MHGYCRFGVLVFALMCGACGGPPTIPAPRDIPTAAQWPGIDVLTLHDSARVHFTPGPDSPRMHVYTDVRKVVLKPEGMQRLRFSAFVSPTSMHVARYDVQVRLPDGEVRKYTLDDFASVPAFAGFVLYSDSRALGLTLNLPAGTVVDARRHTIHHDVRRSVFSRAIEAESPVVRGALTVQTPVGWQAQVIAQQFGKALDLPPSEVITRDEHTAQIWRWDQQDALKSAPYELNPRRRFVVRLKAWPTGAAWADAAEMARAIADYYRPLGALSADDVAFAQRLVDDAAAPLERARRVSEWVRDQVRYCAISIGMGGWIPHPVADVIDHRYGDCKDQALLTSALLDAVKVPSEVVLVHAGSGPRAEFAVPVLGANYNHAIVRVGLDPPVYFDPTRRWVPFGEIGTGIAGAQVLRLSNTGGLDRIPSPDGADRLDAEFALAYTGLAWSGALTLRAWGAQAHALRARVGATDTLQKTALENTAPGPLTVHAVETFLDPARAGEAIRARANVTVEQPASARRSCCGWIASIPRSGTGRRRPPGRPSPWARRARCDRSGALGGRTRWSCRPTSISTRRSAGSR